MVLLLSNKWDLTVDFVVAELRRRGHPFLRLNSEGLASSCASITLPEFRVLVSKRDVVYDLAADVHAIWNRRPGKVYDDTPREERPTPATQRFVSEQWYSWLEGLQLIPDVAWINHPQANAAMESKLRQLRRASEMGFRIPKTLVSNDPDRARAELSMFGDRLVAKALFSPLVEEPEEDFFVFTNEISEIAPGDDEGIRVSPCIFQEPIVPKVDYRVTVVGETVFAVRIASKGTSPVPLDWRTEKDGLQFVPSALPADVERLCRSYVTDNGLLFGAIDLAERNGEFVFLEINPNGEWGWLQQPTGLPIAQSLCDLMIAEDVRKGAHGV
jgi:hypothetical protein